MGFKLVFACLSRLLSIIIAIELSFKLVLPTGAQRFQVMRYNLRAPRSTNYRNGMSNLGALRLESFRK